MRATTLLKTQHREVKSLFAQIKKTDDAGARRALVEKLAQNLAAHMVIEQEIFYPACSEALDDADMLAEAYEEHGVAAFELGRLLAVRTSEDAFEAKAKVLKELIEHHVEEEESELFPKAERALGKTEVARLGAAMALRFQTALKEDYRRVIAMGADARQATGRTRKSGESSMSRVAAKKPRGGTTMPSPRSRGR